MPVTILQERGHHRASTRPGPGQFAWADPNDIAETMESAGFIEPEIDAVDFIVNYDDVDDWWVAQTQMSTRTATPTSRWTSPPAATCWPIWSSAADPFPQPDDSLRIPARTWVATATA